MGSNPSKRAAKTESCDKVRSGQNTASQVNQQSSSSISSTSLSFRQEESGMTVADEDHVLSSSSNVKHTISMAKLSQVIRNNYEIL